MKKPEAPPPCSDYLGAIEHEALGQGHSRVRFLSKAEMANPFGQVQGGILAGMLDHCIGFASFLYDQEQQASTLEMSTHYLRPVRAGEILMGEAEVIRGGSRSLYLEASLRREDGELAARATAALLYTRVFEESFHD